MALGLPPSHARMLRLLRGISSIEQVHTAPSEADNVFGDPKPSILSIVPTTDATSNCACTVAGASGRKPAIPICSPQWALTYQMLLLSGPSGRTHEDGQVLAYL
jgi:hypothetical protein